MEISLKQAVEIYTVCAKAENKSDRTIEWVRLSAKKLETFAGGHIPDISIITPDFLRKFILSLDMEPAYAHHRFNKPLTRPVSPGAKSNYVRGLKSLFSRLFAEEYLIQNPMVKIKTPKVTVREPVILSDSLISRLFSAINKSVHRGFRDFVIFLTLLDTGMRVSELCQLMLSDVDLANGYFRIIGKGNKERYVPMGHKLTRSLLKYLSTFRYADTGSNYFLSPKKGIPSIVTVSRRFLEIMFAKQGLRE